MFSLKTEECVSYLSLSDVTLHYIHNLLLTSETRRVLLPSNTLSHLVLHVVSCTPFFITLFILLWAHVRAVSLPLSPASTLVCNNCKKTSFKIQCKGQTYKTAEISLLCHKVMCLFCTVTFTSELIAKRHSLSCHYKCDYSTNALI